MTEYVKVILKFDQSERMLG